MEEVVSDVDNFTSLEDWGLNFFLKKSHLTSKHWLLHMGNYLVESNHHSTYCDLSFWFNTTNTTTSFVWRISHSVVSRAQPHVPMQGPNSNRWLAVWASCNANFKCFLQKRIEIMDVIPQVIQRWDGIHQVNYTMADYGDGGYKYVFN